MSRGKSTTLNQRTVIKALLPKFESVWDAGKFPSYFKEAEDYRKDRPNNPLAKRWRPSVNCQEHSQRN
uniref:Restriction endonuclease subunit S n=1 Tax=Heterorhabditis bacteriophora TaxID=37862 RepID=A0A1I7XES0_HETBA